MLCQITEIVSACARVRYGLIKRTLVSVKLVPEAMEVSDEWSKSGIIEDFSNMVIYCCAEIDRVEIIAEF